MMSSGPLATVMSGDVHSPHSTPYVSPFPLDEGGAPRRRPSGAQGVWSLETGLDAEKKDRGSARSEYAAGEWRSNDGRLDSGVM